MLSGSGRAEIAEGMAYVYDDFASDRQYGVNHSNGDPDFDCYAYDAEHKGFWIGNFIPIGLFWDLYDDNGIFPISGTYAPSELNWVNDGVTNFTFDQMVDVLDARNTEIDQYREELWSRHGITSGNTNIDYSQLYQSYGF